jgi:transcriptional regulator with XRE-family HTH domain
MATDRPQIGSNDKKQRHLYLVQWRGARGVPVKAIASHMGVSRQTVYRWEVEQWRLDLDKIAGYAEALGDDVQPEQLFRMPDKAPSIDAMLADQSEELKETAADIVRRLVRG